METIAVDGNVIHWPQVCSCCGRETSTTRTYQQVHEHGTGSAPVETIVKKRSRIKIPTCTECRRHIEENYSQDVIGLYYGVVTLLVPTVVYFLDKTEAGFNFLGSLGLLVISPWVLSLITFLMLAAFFLYRWFKRVNKNAHLIGSECASNQGGIKYVKYIPHSVDGTIFTESADQHQFVLMNSKYVATILEANIGHSYKCSEQVEPNSSWSSTTA